jgi:hypothetical protein
MKTNFHRVVGIWVAVMIASTSLIADENESAQQATSADPNTALQAQDSLRDAGPEGLQAIEQVYAKEIEAHQNGAPGDSRWERIAAALNRVGGQYDEYASGLFWYTDLEKAKIAARASGKPILSLRLLGRLDEDLSCANSRFFRTTLYPNAQVNQILRDKFILHWESVRPVPIVTIDFGNGRKLVRTITGNSIHYILDSDGQIIDALPGLYGAQTFAKELEAAFDIAVQDKQAGFSVAAYQDATRQRLLAAWKKDLAATFNADTDPNKITDDSLESATDDKRWRLIAGAHINDAAFDDRTRQVITEKFPAAETAAPLAISKMAVESPLLRAMRNLQNTVALDTVRNNYLLRTKILAFLENSQARVYYRSLDQINDWVYADVFLTPKEDPWLGLAPQDVFTGIAQNGETP